MIRVFIAMPYGDDNTLEQREYNTQAAMDVWHTLADQGFYPYCPHLSHFLQEHRSRDRTSWLAHSVSWLLQCDCVVALGEQTAGVRDEINRARIEGKPVFTTIHSLCEAYGV